MVSRVFVAIENNVVPIKIGVEVEEDLNLSYQNELVVVFQIP